MLPLHLAARKADRRSTSHLSGLSALQPVAAVALLLHGRQDVFVDVVPCGVPGLAHVETQSARPATDADRAVGPDRSRRTPDALFLRLRPGRLLGLVAAASGTIRPQTSHRRHHRRGTADLALVREAAGESHQLAHHRLLAVHAVGKPNARRDHAAVGLRVHQRRLGKARQRRDGHCDCAGAAWDRRLVQACPAHLFRTAKADLALARRGLCGPRPLRCAEGHLHHARPSLRARRLACRASHRRIRARSASTGVARPMHGTHCRRVAPGDSGCAVQHVPQLGTIQTGGGSP